MNLCQTEKLKAQDKPIGSYSDCVHGFYNSPEIFDSQHAKTHGVIETSATNGDDYKSVIYSMKIENLFLFFKIDVNETNSCHMISTCSVI